MSSAQTRGQLRNLAWVEEIVRVLKREVKCKFRVFQGVVRAGDHPALWRRDGSINALAAGTRGQVLLERQWCCILNRFFVFVLPFTPIVL